MINRNSRTSWTQRKTFLRMTCLFSEIYVNRVISGFTYKKSESVNSALTADSTVVKNGATELDWARQVDLPHINGVFSVR